MPAKYYDIKEKRYGIIDQEVQIHPASDSGRSGERGDNHYTYQCSESVDNDGSGDYEESGASDVSRHHRGTGEYEYDDSGSEPVKW